MNNQEIIEKIAKNPKIIKAVKGLLEPLKQEGDTLTISSGKEEEKDENHKN